MDAPIESEIAEAAFDDLTLMLTEIGEYITANGRDLGILAYARVLYGRRDRAEWHASRLSAALALLLVAYEVDRPSSCNCGYYGDCDDRKTN